MTLQPGSPAELRWRKWDGSPHWVHPVIVLGEDETGVWFGQQQGTVSRRPGADFHAYRPNVKVLMPGAQWMPAFFPDREGARIGLYVDIAAELRLEEFGASAIDMDLDVIVRAPRPSPYIDDVDEFSAHRRSMGYPDDVAARALRDARRVRGLAARREGVFDGRAEAWLALMEH